MARNDDLIARLHAKKYTREAWDEPHGAYDQPCDADDYGAEESFVNPAGPDAAREIGRLRTALAERDATIERLTKLVYVPGLWKCPKCKFSLVQANLNALDGTVTARDQPGDKCPNCASPLWRVTERDAGNEMVDRAEEYLVRATTAERERDEARAEVERLRKVVKTANDAIAEYVRYLDGGEMRGSYDGKPERNGLRKAGYATRAALTAKGGGNAEG